MNRISRIAIPLATLAAAGIAASVVVAGNARKSDPQGVHITPLSHATIPSRVNVATAGIAFSTRGPRDMLVTKIVVDPGGTFGWHMHPGPVLVAVSKGTLTLYHPHGSMCMRSTVGAGSGFVEPGGDVHLGRNEGSTPVELNAIFLAPTGTTNFLTPEPAPASCHI
jgi:quercetin dioxygenase-like cupin family protein